MKNKTWWHSKTAYQIYPRSFMDSNGDGIGDINGIISKLDYLKELGVEIVWLSPVYRSPMDDGGYDISDYYDIDPIFGKKEDMDRLIEEAGKRGIKLLMDLVINHCSDEHEWFQKALKDPDCEEAGYFWFRESAGGPPNNWRSMFGGSAWENVGGDRYYLHLFSKKQPDLNWENPVLRQKLYDMVNYWLDKGLGGFRIDAITHIKKDPTLKSYPVDGPDGLAGCFLPTRNYPGIGDYLTDLRKNTFDNYECVTVAEAAGVPYEDLGAYVGTEDGYFDTMFDFSYSEPYSYGHGWHTCKRPGEWDFADWRNKLYMSQTETEKIGYGAVFIENHDYPRSMDKFIPDAYRSARAQRMLGNMYFFLRGIPFIYQGQELGMTNTRMEKIEDFDDISTKNHYRSALKDGYSPADAVQAVIRYSRDNARVPFPWTKGENGGFTTGTPWLKCHPDYVSFAAEEQIKDEDSMFHWYKNMINIRSEYADILVEGSFTPMDYGVEKSVCYARTTEKGRIISINSFSPDVTEYACGNGKVINGDGIKSFENGVLTLEPFGCALILL